VLVSQAFKIFADLNLLLQYFDVFHVSAKLKIFLSFFCNRMFFVVIFGVLGNY
jgi:hypothetical protein